MNIMCERYTLNINLYDGDGDNNRNLGYADMAESTQTFPITYSVTALY
jgi:hypothetical protein